uniref:Uncharacterized protein n=1 Tax=Setaria italica TaxID=4555 RepID=K3Z1R6_SETIT
MYLPPKPLLTFHSIPPEYIYLQARLTTTMTQTRETKDRC